MYEYNYYIGPYVYEAMNEGEVGGDMCYRAPAGSVTSIDLRPASVAGQSSIGYGFFATPGTLGSGYIFLGDSLNDNLPLGLRSTISSSLGIGQLPPGNVKQTIYNILTTHSDPTGNDFVLPLMPTVGGILKISLGGHSIIIQKRLDPKKSIEWANIRDALQRQYARIKASEQAREIPRDHHRRVLNYWAAKYGLRSRKDIKQLIPRNLPFEPPLRRATLFEDDFNRADNDLLGANWTEPYGDHDIVTNEVKSTTASTHNYTPCTVELSGDDQVVISKNKRDATVGIATVSGMARKDSSVVRTMYLFQMYRNDSTPESATRLFKVVSNSFTQIGSNVATTFTNGVQYLNRGEVNGSGLRMWIDGTLKQDETDTAITGNLRCGIHSFCQTNSMYHDDYKEFDISPGVFTGAWGTGFGPYEWPWR